MDNSNMRTGTSTLLQPYSNTYRDYEFTAGSTYIFANYSMSAGKSTPPHKIQLRFKALPYVTPWSSYTD
jgi:hypothetical protein